MNFYRMVFIASALYLLLHQPVVAGVLIILVAIVAAGMVLTEFITRPAVSAETKGPADPQLQEAAEREQIRRMDVEIGELIQLKREMELLRDRVQILEEKPWTA